MAKVGNLNKLLTLGSLDGNKLIDDTIMASKINQTVIDKALDGKYIFVENNVENFTTTATTSNDVSVEIFDSLFTKGGSGSATVKGVITNTTPTSMVASSTSQTIFAATNEVYCEISKTESDVALDITWTNASNQISTTGTAFIAGSIFRNPEDLTQYYKVISILGNDGTLDRAYIGTTSTETIRKTITFKINYFTNIAGAQTAHTMDGSNINFKYQESYSLLEAPSTSFSESIKPAVGSNGVAYNEQVPFSFASGANTLLQDLTATSIIEAVVIRVINIFDNGGTASIGFPADNTEIVNTLALNEAGDFEYEVDRISTIVESLRLYLSSLGTTGNGIIFFKGTKK